MNKGSVSQILLITDGCSNQGEDPVAVSRHIVSTGVSVNVIGVLDDDQTEEPIGLREVNEIAEAGKGVSRIVYADDLSETMQMVTQQAMTQTIQGYVNQELKSILGDETNEEALPPETRGEVQEVMEDLSETVDLNMVILVDTSASMQTKMSAVKEALDDLMISLDARQGQFMYTVYQFPTRKQVVKLLLDWTDDGKRIAKVFPKFAVGGITPTGSALREAAKAFHISEQDDVMRGAAYDVIDPSYRSSS
ncbi:vWA domain-containing protein [Alkalibacillus almallahensis]|uniref:vWA domain-containing protein n=1 Tax=Alkalibacillus almallahensis TaxID=1379154 RepID=UPI0014239C7D|nr:VWA domain-containing protein [Alkalibacillus almallahensis]NIK12693.1 Ca-activated chloride channel family protein [Alkalibacillus almallahensis]